MLPAAYISIDRLPLTPSGKADRSALAATAAGIESAPAAYVMPRDQCERRLADIWGEVLAARAVGVTDNFFDLGGHSLLAIRLFARIEQEFARKLPVALIFQAPTIEQLARIMRQDGNQPVWRPLVAIQPLGTKPPLFYIPPNGFGIEFYNIARILGLDQPVYVLIETADGKPDYTLSPESEARWYLELIRTVQPKGPYYLAGYSSGGTVAYEMAQQLVVAGEQVALLAMLDCGFPPRGLQARVLAYRRRLRYIARLGPRVQLQRVRGRLERFARRVLRRPRLLDPNAGPPRPVRRMHPRARYIPRQYPGQVVWFYTFDPNHAGRIRMMLRQWQRLAKGGVETYNISGDHWVLMNAEHGQILAAQLRVALDAAHARVGVAANGKG
jgi:aspartate racemase